MASQQNAFKRSQPDFKENYTSEEITSDTVLQQIGSFGIFQKLLFFFYLFCLLFWSCLNGASVLFMIAEPPWQCRKVREFCLMQGILTRSLTRSPSGNFGQLELDTLIYVSRCWFRCCCSCCSCCLNPYQICNGRSLKIRISFYAFSVSSFLIINLNVYSITFYIDP